jgi:hypothetical protein
MVLPRHRMVAVAIDALMDAVELDAFEDIPAHSQVEGMLPSNGTSS